MIIALEGAPGVGKSTLAQRLAAAGAFVVPEVNRLFARPAETPRGWYLDRQNARWEMAKWRSAQGTLSILDGDPFQPLWFNWAFQHEPQWEPWREAADFYRARIRDGQMDFADRYVILTASEEERQRRLLAREAPRGAAHARAKNARYVPLVGLQQRYFQALADAFPNWIVFASDPSVEEILRLRAPSAKADALAILDYAGRWLAAHRPETFS